MAFGWSKTRYSPIAVDFGSQSLKLLQIIPTDPPQMVAAATVPIPEQARKQPAARHAFYVETLRRLLKQGGFKGRKAICSLPAYQTLVQNLEIARIEQEDFDEQIALQLRQRMNVDTSRMVIRHHHVGQVVRDGSPKQEVICFAASREAVIRHIETAHRAKLDVIGMHAEPLAILQAFAHLYRRDSDTARTTCFIDIGAATSKIVIAHGADLAFAKTIHAAGDHLTRALATARGISYDQAMQMRMHAEDPADTPDQIDAADAADTAAASALDEAEASAPSPAPAGGGLAILEAQLAAERRGPRPMPHPQTPGLDSEVSEAMDCLIDELQMCVRYHHSLFPDRQIEKLVFLGGEARNVQVCQRIARSLRIGAQLGDPMARMVRVSQARPPQGVDMRQPQPGWAVPLGLCLSEANL